MTLGQHRCSGVPDHGKREVVLSYSPENWQTISKLLDQALDLPREARDSWLEALPEPDSAFREQLREMLAHQAAAETADFLETLPKLTAAQDSSEVPPSLAGAATDLRVGPYRLLRELGRGGMAVVWLAERADGQFTRTVALKVPLAMHAGSELAQRFARERDILAKLEHPHIARFYDAGVAADGTPYLAMEFIEGRPIDAFCDARQLNVRARLGLFRQVLDAVQYAHARLVIHRDLKPSNILVTGDGEVHLLDFGIAKLLGNDDTAAETQLTEVHGRALTPSYASPEQIRGESLTTATDIYSLGVVLYQLLTGARPYKLKTSSPAQLELAIAEAEVLRPSAAITAAGAAARGTTAPKLAKALHGDLDTILLKALKKDPGDRYTSAGAFAEDLRRYGDGEPVQARPDSAWYRTRKFIGRNRLAVASAAVVVIALAAGMSVALWQYQQAIEQARIAREEAKTAAAVQGFMEDIFKTNSTDNPDPERARKTTAEELLDIAGKKMEGAMLDAPKARLNMLSILEELYEQLGLNGKAIATAKLGWDTTVKTGMGPAAELDSLGSYEGALIEDLQLERAEQVQRRRLELVRELKIDDPRVLARIELSQGVLGVYLKRPEAMAHIDRGIELSRRAGLDSELVNGLFFKANSLNGPGSVADPAAARTALLEAKAVLDRLNGTPEGDGMQIRRISIDVELSRSAMNMDDPAEAVRYGKLAVRAYLALHQHDDPGARNSSGEVAFAMMDSARPLEAIAYLDGLWHLTDAAGPEVESDDQIALLRAYAAAQNSSGRVEDALSTLDREMRLLARVSAQRLWPTFLERDRTNAFIELGQLALAESALERATAAASRDQQKPEYLLLPRARLALAKGKSEEARENLSALLNSTNLHLSQRNRLGAECLIAEAWLIDGRGNEAEEVAGKALARIESFNQREALADLESRALWVRGRALLGRNEPAAALPSLERAATLLEGVVDTRVSLQLSHVLGSLAQAQFRTGHALEARKTFERMKTIYAQHPDIGPTVRAELASVARELSARS